MSRVAESAPLVLRYVDRLGEKTGEFSARLDGDVVALEANVEGHGRVCLRVLAVDGLDAEPNEGEALGVRLGPHCMTLRTAHADVTLTGIPDAELNHWTRYGNARVRNKHTYLRERDAMAFSYGGNRASER